METREQKIPTFEQLTCELRPPGVAVVRLALLTDGVPDDDNRLNEEALAELDEVARWTANHADVRAVVLTSAHASFSVGADPRLFAGAVPDDRDEIEARVRRFRRAADRIAEADEPWVCAIHGKCLGGGLELALACHTRLATASSSTRLGVPEVKLGLLPGAGGTQRLVPVVGLQDALSLLLTGKLLGPRAARSNGLVDDVCDPPALVARALKRAVELADGEGPSRASRATEAPAYVGEKLQQDTAVGRRVVFKKARGRVLEQTRGNFPAPLEILEVVRTGLKEGLEAGLAREAASFADLAVTEEAQSLLRVALGREELHAGDDEPPARALVVGAGLMGGGIAAASVTRSGMHVRLRDVDRGQLRVALRGVHEELEGSADKEHLTELEAERRQYRVTTTERWDGFRGVDVVLEAVPEDLDLKRQVFAEIEAAVDDDVVIASNTSALPIGDIAAEAQRPERICGMHFFSPVPKMPLVEIVRAERTGDEAVRRCAAWARAMGKAVVIVRDSPGFYMTRVLAPLFSEAARMLEEGVSAERIDDALEGFGFSVGPVKLVEQIGEDVVTKASENLQPTLGARVHGPVERNDDGDLELPQEQIAWRAASLLIDETVRCLTEGLIASPRDADLAAVLGFGFPPFTGGPLHLLDTVTPGWLVRRMSRLEDEYGPRFAPCVRLRELAEAGERVTDDAVGDERTAESNA